MKLQKQALELFWHRILPNYFTGLLGALRLFTVGWLSGKQRGLLYQINRFYGTYRNYPEPRLPRQRVSEVLNAELPILLVEAAETDGNAPMLDLLVLVQLVRATNPKVLFEIGTFDGRTALNLAANASPDARVYTLDLPPQGANDTNLPISGGDVAISNRGHIAKRFENSRFSHQVQQLLGDSATFDFSPYHGKVDFVFVDGSHTYEYVRNDTEKALKLLRGGKGTILWHDYSDQPGVTTYLNELHAKGTFGTKLRHIEGTMLAWAQF